MNTLIMKVLCGVLAAVALLLLVQDRNHWKRVASDRNTELGRVLDATREAAANPKLDRAGMVRQIVELGRSLTSTRSALDEQNAAIKRQAAEAGLAQARSASAYEEALGRLGGPLEARVRLEASARSPDRTTQPCELSPALKDAWR